MDNTNHQPQLKRAMDCTAALLEIHKTQPELAMRVFDWFKFVQSELGEIIFAYDALVDQIGLPPDAISASTSDALVECGRRVVAKEARIQALESAIMKIKNAMATESPIPGYEIEKRPPETILKEIMAVAKGVCP